MRDLKTAISCIDAPPRRAVELVHPKRRAVKIPDVAEVIKLMQNSPTAAFLRGCSLHERLMLAALVKCVKREGVEEIKWGEVCALRALSRADVKTY